MDWKQQISGFKTFLKLEKSLSENSIEAYISDVLKLASFLEIRNFDLPPESIALSHLKEFIKWFNELGLSARSQARIISGIKAFYKYLLIEDIIETDPTTLLDTPRIGRKLPEVLSVEEIDMLLGLIDLSKPEGQRNKAMIEVLYSCGFGGSELFGLDLYKHFYD